MRTPKRAMAVPIAIVALTGCSVFSSPSATLISSSEAIGPSQEVTLSGAFSEEKPGLKVQLESASGATYTPTGQATSTDNSGAYKFTFTTTSVGKVSLRVLVINGGDRVKSSPVKLTVLNGTGLQARFKGPPEVGLNKSKLVVGEVRPGVSGRKVTLETSLDGSGWAPFGKATTSEADGTYSLPAPTTDVGPVQLRVKVEPTSTSAAATSTTLKLFVADYEAAGKMYLSCVADSNRAVDKLVPATNDLNAGRISLKQMQKLDRKYANALKDTRTCIRNYDWPPSVSRFTREMVDQDAVVIDNQTRMAKAKSLTAYNEITYSSELAKAFDKVGAAAAQIRRGLGLPARDS